MKKKIITIFLILALLLTNFAFEIHAISTAYTRTGGTRVDSIATKITDDLYLDGDYSAYTNEVNTKDIEIYDYESNVRKTYTGNANPTYFDDTPNKYCGLSVIDGLGRYCLEGMMYFRRKSKI